MQEMAWLGLSILLQEGDVGLAGSRSQNPGLVPASSSDEHPHLTTRNKEPVEPGADGVAVVESEARLTWQEASLLIATVIAPIERRNASAVGVRALCQDAGTRSCPVGPVGQDSSCPLRGTEHTEVVPEQQDRVKRADARRPSVDGLAP